MARSKKNLTGWLVAALASAPEPAFAQTASEPVRFAYASPEGCPKEAHFREEVSARTAKFHAAEAKEPARVFTIIVEGDARQSSGHLEVQGVNGNTSRRDVPRGTCDEVVSALALITAVAIDPDATIAAPAPVAAPSPSGEVTAPALPDAPAPAPPTPSAPRPVALQPLTSPVPAPRAPAAATLVWTAAASVESFLGLVPAMSIGGGAAFTIAPAQARKWVPEGRLTLLGTTADASFSGSTGANLLWALARVEGCALRMAFSERVGVGPCLAVDAGLLGSVGSGVSHSDGATRGWFAIDALARVEVEAFANVLVQVGGGITVPIRRYEFSYDPGTGVNESVYRLPAVAAVANAGLAYRFR